MRRVELQQEILQLVLLTRRFVGEQYPREMGARSFERVVLSSKTELVEKRPLPTPLPINEYGPDLDRLPAGAFTLVQRAKKPEVQVIKESAEPSIPSAKELLYRKLITLFPQMGWRQGVRPSDALAKRKRQEWREAERATAAIVLSFDGSDGGPWGRLAAAIDLHLLPCQFLSVAAGEPLEQRLSIPSLRFLIVDAKRVEPFSSLSLTLCPVDFEELVGSLSQKKVLWERLKKALS